MGLFLSLLLVGAVFLLLKKRYKHTVSLPDTEVKVPDVSPAPSYEYDSPYTYPVDVKPSEDYIYKAPSPPRAPTPSRSHSTSTYKPSRSATSFPKIGGGFGGGRSGGGGSSGSW
jgi:uncharacterized membrane protein YgcG